MGKRKSSATPAPRKRMPNLDTAFTCPFCSYASRVEFYIGVELGIGAAACGVCGERFTTTVTTLTEPIDIYNEWIDECERAN